MGRINATGQGYGCQPNAYYMTLSAQGDCELYVVMEDRKVKPKLLASGKVIGVKANNWHNVKLQFSGSNITGFVDNVQVLQAIDKTYAKGMIGLMTTDENPKRTTAQFDNIVINAMNKTIPAARNIAKNVSPIYKK
jgi:galactosylceramidase